MTYHSEIRTFERGGISPDEFFSAVLPESRPAIFRSLVSEWPIVAASRLSVAAFVDYLKAFASGENVTVAIGPPEIAGRLFYDHDVKRLNFRKDRMPLDAALDLLIASMADVEPDAVAIQSLPMQKNLPGFAEANLLGLLPNFIEARAWIGNRVTIAAHYDSSENIACVVAGRRRFTLFPPDQACNLYPGPFELTPAGPVVSMVDFDRPDLKRYPRFADALQAAITIDLKPGDAVYIPYLWWHHVRSLEPLNMLVNYWWNPETPTLGQPLDAMLHAMLAIKGLPDAHRQAWASMFSYYVFQTAGSPAAHLPPGRNGIQGILGRDELRDVRKGIARTMTDV